MSVLLRVLTWLLALALIALPVVGVMNGWFATDRWPLRTLRLEGDLQRVDQAAVRAAVLPHARRGFFAVRLEDARHAVAKLPWVAEANVQKRWPDVLVVTIVEHKPFARWGTDALVSEKGEVFPATGYRIPAGMPLLGGPVPRAREVIRLYGESRELFAPLAMQVQSLQMDDRGSWTMQLSNGTQVLVGGSEAKARLARFARVLPRLLADKPAPRRADLRYTNGFALTWAPTTVATGAAASQDRT